MGYWDIEDGTDCIQKTWITTKLGAMVGLIGSAYYILAYQPKIALEGITKATTGTLTMASLGAIFGITTCLSAEVREKPDDPANYFVGGCASGIFLGVRTRNYMTATAGCLAFGTVAALTKIGKTEGWVFLPSEPKV